MQSVRRVHQSARVTHRALVRDEFLALARLHINMPHTGAAIEPIALVQVAVIVEGKPLRERIGFVRKRLHDLVGAHVCRVERGGLQSQLAVHSVCTRKEDEEDR